MCKMADRFSARPDIRPSSSQFADLLISDVVFTGVTLGRGADATVYEVEWNGTRCAAKRLHEILLVDLDQSPGGADKLISNLEAECLTWSKLRHPGVVQFLGVYLEPSSRLPVLVMERMDTSLREHLGNHSKEDFSLQLKVFVLRQVAEAIAYLHNHNPPLVHHDLSPNNVLLNMVSFVTKVTDFGMSRTITTPYLTSTVGIVGTQAFTAPEALQFVPKYDTMSDIFSYGNIILSTITHKWPNPGLPVALKGAVTVRLTELQRRERYIEMFTAQEKQLFLPIVSQCLENEPDKRPSSAMLVQELRPIEASLVTSAQSIEQQQQIAEAEKGALDVQFENSTLRKWTKGKLLGRGGGGAVFLCTNDDTGQQLAVKLLDIDPDNDEAIKCLEVEIQQLKKLQHKRIVTYFGSERTEEQLRIFIEYMPGGSLEQQLKKGGKLNEALTRKYTRQILEGVTYLHDRKVVHRDIKGANILLDSDANVKLADFGISKQLHTVSSGFSTHSAKGTCYWMAPEVILGQSKQTTKVDIWSVGCTVVQMLTGKPPLHNLEPFAAMFKIGHEPERFRSYLSLDCSEDVEDFLSNCFVVSPEARRSAVELLDLPFLMVQKH